MHEKLITCDHCNNIIPPKSDFIVVIEKTTNRIYCGWNCALKWHDLKQIKNVTHKTKLI